MKGSSASTTDRLEQKIKSLEDLCSKAAHIPEIFSHRAAPNCIFDVSPKGELQNTQTNAPIRDDMILVEKCEFVLDKIRRAIEERVLRYYEIQRPV